MIGIMGSRTIYQITSGIRTPLRARILETQVQALSNHSTRVTKVIEFDQDTSMMLMAHRSDLFKPPDPSHPYTKFIGSWHARHISNSLKHMHALRLAGDTIADTTDASTFHFILEDDSVVINGKIDELFANVPKDADIVFLGIPVDKQDWSQNPMREFATSPLPVCDSYIVRAGVARRLFDAFLPLRGPTNVHLSMLIENLGLKCYMSKFPIFIDGSKVGFTSSQLTCNNVLLWNTTYMELARKIASPIEDFDALWTTIDPNMLNASPDLWVIRAKNRNVNRDVASAKAMYDRALTMYETDRCLVNQTCAFLNEYIDLHKPRVP